VSAAFYTLPAASRRGDTKTTLHQSERMPLYEAGAFDVAPGHVPPTSDAAGADRVSRAEPPIVRELIPRSTVVLQIVAIRRRIVRALPRSFSFRSAHSTNGSGEPIDGASKPQSDNAAARGGAIIVSERRNFKLCRVELPLNLVSKFRINHIAGNTPGR